MEKLSLTLYLVLYFVNVRSADIPLGSSCLNGRLYTLFNVNTTFDASVTKCQSLGASLARISSLTEYNQVLALIQSRSFTEKFWIGLGDIEKTSLADDATRFRFVDGVNDDTALSFIRTTFGTFPWSTNNPNGNCGTTACNVEDCVEWQPLTNNLWNDKECDAERAYLCRSTCPTPAPTKTPTKRPTKAPTRNPTKKPTKSPTKAPTRLPTNTPSKSPTKFPTKSPSDSPSSSPTKSPSDSPSSSPTVNPTISPSKTPTKSPTTFPTRSPTEFVNSTSADSSESFIFGVIGGLGGFFGVFAIVSIIFIFRKRHSRNNNEKDLLDSPVKYEFDADDDKKSMRIISKTAEFPKDAIILKDFPSDAIIGKILPTATVLEPSSPKFAKSLPKSAVAEFPKNAVVSKTPNPEFPKDAVLFKPDRFDLTDDDL